MRPAIAKLREKHKDIPDSFIKYRYLAKQARKGLNEAINAESA
jgi:hypothetical protein